MFKIDRLKWFGMYCGWEKREYVRQCYTQKWSEKYQQEDPEPNGQTKLERVSKRDKKIGKKYKKNKSGRIESLVISL